MKYNSLTREWQLRRGNSSRKSWWSGKSTYFVGIFWAWCQLAVSTYLLKHDYSARKDWADSVFITSAVSNFLPARCSSAHFPPWILFLKLHRAVPLFTMRVLIKNSCSKGFWQTLCQFLAGPSQNGSHVRGVGGAYGQIKERMWPSASDTFHSFHALIAIRKVSVCFYCIQHRHLRLVALISFPVISCLERL